MSSSRLLTVVRDRAAVRRYSPRTTQAYVQWIVRYVRWNGLRHPATLGGVEVRDFLTYLARERHVAASTQNQALAALQFLYRDVLEQPLGEVSGLAPARRPTLLPNVLSREAVQRVLACLTGVPLLMAQLCQDDDLAGVRIKRVAATDTYVPLAAAANLVLVQQEDIEREATALARLPRMEAAR